MKNSINNSATILGTARSLYGQRNFKESEAEFQKLVDSDATKAEGYYGLGMIRYGMGELNSAAGLLEKCLQSDAKHANATYYLGDIRRRTGNLQAATELLQRSVELSPQNAEAYYQLGRIAESDKRADEAAAYFRKSLEIQPALARRHQMVLPGLYHHLSRDTTPLVQNTLQLLDSLHRKVVQVRPIFSAYYPRILLRLFVCFWICVAVGSIWNEGHPREFFPTAPPAPAAAASPALASLPPFPDLSGLLTTFFLASVLMYLFSKAGRLTAWLTAKGAGRPEKLFINLTLLLLAAAAFFEFVTRFSKSRFLGESLAIVITLSVLYLIYYVAWIGSLRFTFDEGRIRIKEGVFALQLRNIELYRIMDLQLHQTFWNRRTGDGSLYLFVEGVEGNHSPVRIELTGICKIDQLRELFEELRNAVALLRSSYVGKGIIY